MSTILNQATGQVMSQSQFDAREQAGTLQAGVYCIEGKPTKYYQHSVKLYYYSATDESYDFRFNVYSTSATPIDSIANLLANSKFVGQYAAHGMTSNGYSTGYYTNYLVNGVQITANSVVVSLIQFVGSSGMGNFNDGGSITITSADDTNYTVSDAVLEIG